MPCDDPNAMHETVPAQPHSATVADSGATSGMTRRQPGSALRQLETGAQGELRRMLGERAALHGGIADPVWAGLAWDMGLSGGAIAAAGTSLPLPGYAALSDTD